MYFNYPKVRFPLVLGKIADIAIVTYSTIFRFSYTAETLGIFLRIVYH